MVAVQERRLPSASGKAEIPGEGWSMSCISSACRLHAEVWSARCSFELVKILGFSWTVVVGVGLKDEPFGHALRLVPLSGRIQLGSFQRIGRRVLGIIHGVVHREEVRRRRSGTEVILSRVNSPTGGLECASVASVARGLLSGMTTDSNKMDPHDQMQDRTS